MQIVINTFRVLGVGILLAVVGVGFIAATPADPVAEAWVDAKYKAWSDCDRLAGKFVQYDEAVFLCKRATLRGERNVAVYTRRKENGEVVVRAKYAAD